MPDILPTSEATWVPAESAVSDNPSASQVVEPPPADPPVVTPPVETPPADTTPPESDPAQDDQSSSTTEPRPARGVQKALDRLTREREEAREAERAANERLDRALAALEKAPPAEPPKTAGPPKPEDFSSVDEYDSAVIEYRVSQAVEQRFKAETERREQNDQRARLSAAIQAATETFKARKAEAIKTLTDFDEVVTNDAQVAPAVALHLLHSEVGPQVAYRLAKNPSELAHLNGLSNDPNALAKEIGKLEAKVLYEPLKPVSKASPPITPTRGSGPETKIDLERMSMEDFVATRNKEEAAARGR